MAVPRRCLGPTRSDPASHTITLRVHPGSWCGLTKPSEHHSDGGPAQESEAVSVQAFPILGKTAAAVEPSDGSLDDPAFGQHDEFVEFGTLDDFQVDLAANGLQSVLEFRALIAAVGIQLQQERVEPKQAAHQQHSAVAVLDVGRMNDRLHQQTLRVDDEVSLLAFDLLARVIPRRVDRTPPFSAPLAL